jgi:serine/threonine protein kinase
VIGVYDVGRLADGKSFIVTRLIEGTSLSEHLQAGRPSFTQTAEWLATIAEALQAAHEKGLVHRDVKPSNILIDQARRPFIGDFGLALREEELLTALPGFHVPLGEGIAAKRNAWYIGTRRCSGDGWAP